MAAGIPVYRVGPEDPVDGSLLSGMTWCDGPIPDGNGLTRGKWELFPVFIWQFPVGSPQAIARDLSNNPGEIKPGSMR